MEDNFEEREENFLIKLWRIWHQGEGMDRAIESTFWFILTTIDSSLLEQRLAEEDASRLRQEIRNAIHQLQRLQGQAESFSAIYTEWQPRRVRTINKLKEFVKILDGTKSVTNKGKIAGTSASILGGATFVTGLLLAPFTFGASYVAIAGLAAAGVGSATTIGFGVANIRSEWWAQSDVKQIVEADANSSKNFRQVVGELLDSVQILEQITTGIQDLVGTISPHPVRDSFFTLQLSFIAPIGLFAKAPHMMCMANQCLVINSATALEKMCDVGSFGGKVGTRGVAAALMGVSMLVDSIELASVGVNYYHGSKSTVGKQITTIIEILEDEQAAMARLSGNLNEQ